MPPSVQPLGQGAPRRRAPASADDAPAGAPFSPISRRTLNDEVYNQLRDQLMAGAISPGSTLTIRDLAGSFGISPMPVREALRRLVAERALVMLPNRSVAVPVLSRAQFEETTLIRASLEGLAAEAATSRIDALGIAAMERANAKMAGSRKGLDAAYLEHNRAFHFTLYQSSGMPTLVTLIESLWLRIGPLLTYAIMNAGYRATVVPLHHQQVLEGLAKRRRRLVRAAIVGDIMDAARIVARQL